MEKLSATIEIDNLCLTRITKDDLDSIVKHKLSSSLYPLLQESLNIKKEYNKNTQITKITSENYILGKEELTDMINKTEQTIKRIREIEEDIGKILRRLLEVL